MITETTLKKNNVNLYYSGLIKMITFEIVLKILIAQNFFRIIHVLQ